MGIKITTPESAINELLNAVPNIIASEIVRAFTYLGEVCVTRIRDRGWEESWIDRTGNLRSSIGYAVFSQGKKVIESAFNVVKDGTKGAEEGRKLIDKLASLYSETFALVVVAGMEYAELVEAHDNKDVLASTELYAKKELQKYLDNALKRAEIKIAALQRSLGL